MADKQAVRKLPIPPLSTTYTTKTSKQKKTNEEKQAKKKELDWATLEGGALETSWSTAGREGEGPGSCTCSNFQAKSTLFSVLSTAALMYKFCHLRFYHILLIDNTLLDCQYFMSPREGADPNENSNQLVSLTRRSKNKLHGGDGREEGIDI